MFIGKFVKKLFKKDDKNKGDKRIKSKVKGGVLKEEMKVEVIKNSKNNRKINLNIKDEFEIYTYEELLPNILIDDYIDYLSARKTTASSVFSTDEFIPLEKIKLNVGPKDFVHLKVIGRGYFGKVTQVRFTKDDKIYALKTLKKSKLKEAKHIEHTKAERKILETVHHPFIVSLKFAFQTEKKLYFVMDCYNGGELFYHLRNRGRFNESQAKFYLIQILLAIEFLHSHKIIYRDLKPENIVLDSNGYIKLTDFGLAKDNITDDSGCTQTFCGTPEYLAPEIIRNDKYGKSVDIWCIGILFYEMLYGFPPFYDKNKDKLYKKIIFNEPDFSRNPNVKLSADAKDLLLRMLHKNQKNRIKISQIKEHKFFENYNIQDILSCKVTPPFKPELKGNDDYKYIDPMLANEKAEDSVYNGFSPLVMKGKNFAKTS